MGERCYLEATAPALQAQGLARKQISDWKQSRLIMLKQQLQPPGRSASFNAGTDRRQAISHFRSAFRRSAQRAFIRSESLFRPAALSRRLRGACVAALFAPPRRALSLAQRALAAAAIFARAAAERGRRAPLGLAPPGRPPNKLVSRLSNTLICLRIDNACSKADSDKSIDSRNR
jgi:hypothetical protein